MTPMLTRAVTCELVSKLCPAILAANILNPEMHLVGDWSEASQ
jgi:hypothetical protein